MSKVIGIDLGAQKTMMVAEDGEIIRTDTGSISWATLIAFHGKSRLVGEEALPQITGDNTVTMVNNLIGKSVADAKSMEILKHVRCRLSSSEENSLSSFDLSYFNEIQPFDTTSLLSMFISKLIKRISEVYSSPYHIVFPLPPSTPLPVKKAILQACEICRLDTQKVSTIDTSDCLVKTYSRKIQGIRESEKAGIEGKKALIIDMGHTQTTMILVDVTDEGPITLASRSDLSLGAVHFDIALFNHFSSVVKTKTGSEVTPGTKRGARLLSSCERLRKLLSQLSEASVTVENLTDNGDMSFSLRRDELSSLCGALLNRFKGLIREIIKETNISVEAVSNVEVLGGGVRMQVVQAAIWEVLGEGKPLGAKLDDVSIALGGALLTQQSLSLSLSSPPSTSPTPPTKRERETETEKETEKEESVEMETDTPVTEDSSTVMEVEKEREREKERDREREKKLLEEAVGLSTVELERAIEREREMRERDEEVRALQAGRNELEAYILEMRGASGRKHGTLINNSFLSVVLDEYENWLWDFSEEASLSTLQEKNEELKKEVDIICKDYFGAVEREREAVERALEEESKKAEAERAAEGEDEDHDNRKLKKVDRMRLVVKNKEEGNELFRGKNTRPAAARYHKALTHCAKFFDLTKEDEKEVNQLKLSLHLNLAQCYINMENWEQAMRNCDDALKLDEYSVKALFRRSAVWEQKKEWEKAMQDLKNAEKIATDDKMIGKAIDRVKKMILKEKEKEKKTWGGAFAKA